MINKEQLEEVVMAAGAFLGLLTPKPGNEDSFEVNEDFFKDPSEVIKESGDRLNDLIDLFYAVLGTSKNKPPAGSPPVFDSANWLMVQNPVNGGKSPLYIVVPEQSDGDAPDSGQIGLGALIGADYPKTHFGAEIYVYIPLFNYSTTGTTFLLGQDDASFQIGINISDTEKFIYKPVTGEEVTFTGINISSSIFFSEKLPEFKLEFENLTGTDLNSKYSKLSSLLQPNVDNWLGTALLNNPIVGNYLRKNILENTNAELVVTLGSLLEAVGFIKSSNPSNPLDPNAIFNLTLNTLPHDPKVIAVNFLFGMLDTLSNQILLKVPGGGIFIAERDDPNPTYPDYKQYGVGLRMDMPLNNGEGTESSKPAVDLCLGAWLTGEDDKNNWMERSKKAGQELPTDGLFVWLINHKKSNTAIDVNFSPGFSFSSVGVNIDGSAGKPLFSINGYTLKGVELRATLDGDPLLEPKKWTFGFAAKLDQIGFPLLPPSQDGGGSENENKVAQSLVQTKDSSSDQNNEGSKPGDNTPVNPTFGLAMAWYLDGNFNLQLFDSKDQPSEQVMIPINRQLGPLSCEQIGIGWINKTHFLSILFDGGVTIGPLSVTLQGLTVGIPVTEPTDLKQYTLDLQGMGISFEAGAVSLTAAFEKIPKTVDHPYVEYDGVVAIKAGSFAISAIGSYAYLEPQNESDGYTSLFIFGVLDAPLGGPEFFFVTGLALGFAYNRSIILPDQNNVPNFPFVKMLKDPTEYGDTNDVTGVLSKIDDVVPPERGEYWLAAGVRFTSFDLINASALVSVEFGNELEIGILGDAWMSLPPPSPGGPPPSFKFLYVELGIDIQILPSKGVVSATAIITPNSFLFYQDCRLTGGFAFYVWFGSNPHAGQFVFTVGGYNPFFKVPTYYPKVPRLGFDWNIGQYIVLSGTSYFALTSSAIMAGGGLSLVFHFSIIKAWFIAKMDALVQWAPFQYELDIAISIGVSVRLHLLFVTITITLKIGAGLLLYGPPLGGVVHISLYIISFSIKFGHDAPEAAATISWDDFAAMLLPKSKDTSANDSTRLIANEIDYNSIELASNSTSDNSNPAILTISAVGGVIGYLPKDKNVWIVRPSKFAFSAISAFPCSEITVDDPAVSITTSDKPIHVRPMGVSIDNAILNVTLKETDLNALDDGSNASNNCQGDNDNTIEGNYILTPDIKTLAAAKWGEPLKPNPKTGRPAVPEMNHSLPGHLMGFQSIKPGITKLTPVGNEALNIDSTIAFEDIVVNEDDQNHLPLLASTSPIGNVPESKGEASWVDIKQSLSDQAVTAARNSIFNILISNFGIDPNTNDLLESSDFASDPGKFLNGFPLILEEEPQKENIYE